MNCEEFRRQLLTDPYGDDASFRAHARGCHECARSVEEALRFERRLRTALSAELPTPREREPRRSGTRQAVSRYALLASPLALAALWLGFHAGLRPDSDGDLASNVIAHIRAEADHLKATGRIPAGDLMSLFRSLGAQVDPALGPASFAGRCVIGGEEGIHLVLPGRRGAVTALIMPGTDVPEVREISGIDLEGVILPARFGSVAIVGEPGEPLGPIARRLLVAVRWDAPK